MNNRGDTATGNGVLFIPRTVLFNAQMNSTDITTGGFQGSAMHNTVLPTVVNNIRRVLGSYLAPMHVLTTNTVNTSIPSMAGAGWTGASVNWSWETVYATLMSEIQVYGSTVFSSSFFDIGEACFKLPVFNFISFVEYSRSAFWLRSVSSSPDFALANYSGVADGYYASTSLGVRPLILLS